MMLGFIGLGYMGSRMAMRLVRAGYQLGVYDRHVEKARAFADQGGARAYDSPAELAHEADLVLSMLSDDAVVEQVLLGPSGVIGAALDAAVSGSTPQAEDGSLVMFVGGERAVYERCQPILDVLSNQVFYLGASGAGTTMKLVA